MAVVAGAFVCGCRVIPSSLHCVIPLPSPLLPTSTLRAVAHGGVLGCCIGGRGGCHRHHQCGGAWSWVASPIFVVPLSSSPCQSRCSTHTHPMSRCSRGWGRWWSWQGGVSVVILILPPPPSPLLPTASQVSPRLPLPPRQVSSSPCCCHCHLPSPSSPITLGCCCCSTHHPPHERLLTRLEVGGALFVVVSFTPSSLFYWCWSLLVDSRRLGVLVCWHRR
jgi:hypothetical protein